jgi:metal-responsive CopG/Arc/MetJ family transcriptional regulator
MAKETKQIGVRMPVDLLERIDRLAEIEHRDRSNMIIHILSMYVESLEGDEGAPGRT